MTQKTMPKSLHTVTVLVRVAALFQRYENCAAEEALDLALIQLGYGAAPDDYGLAASALKQLTKGA